MKLTFFLFLLLLKSLPAEVTAEQMFVKALKDGDLQAIESLISVGFNPSLPVHGYTPLYFAIQLNRTDVVDLLLSGHADPNALVMSGSEFSQYGGNATPLQLAVLLGNERLAMILIERGAHIDAKGATGRTALQYAVSDSHLEIIHYLIEKGADLSVRDSQGSGPLDDAVWHGSLDTIAILLAHGSRLNEPETQTGATPINEAAFMGRTAIVQYLLQFHPDLGIPDKRGYLPLDNAIRMRKEESARLLLEAAPKEQQTPPFLGKTMEAATQKNESMVVAALLKQGAPTNDFLPTGATPLDLAAFAGAAKVVRLLLDHSADPNLSGRNGATPLEDASLKGFESIVGMLLDHGARVNQLNIGSGTTALYAAASYGKGEVVKLLLDRGANPTLCGSHRKTPYQVALENGYKEVAAEIQNHGGAGSCEQ